MKKLKIAVNLSQNEVLIAAKVLRDGSRKVIAPHLKENMAIASHMLDEFFETVTLQFVQELKTEVTNINRKVVSCKNLESFINFVMRHRNVSVNLHLKFGVDGG